MENPILRQLQCNEVGRRKLLEERAWEDRESECWAVIARIGIQDLSRPERVQTSIWSIVARRLAEPFVLDEMKGGYQDIDTHRMDIFTCGSYERSHKELYGFLLVKLK